MKRLWTIFLLAMAMAVLSWPDAPQAVQAVQAQQKAKDPTPDVPSVTLPATVQIDAPGLIVIRATRRRTKLQPEHPHQRQDAC